jgi:hypothetical protein
MMRSFLALLLVVSFCFADVNCLDANTIADLADKSKNALDNFFSETLYQRLAVEYHNEELSNKYKTAVADAAQKYAQTLAQILAEQLELKKEIEDYNSGDWEQRFGTTGVWNNLKSEISNSQTRLNCLDGFRTFNKVIYADAFETDANSAFAQLKTSSDELFKKLLEKWPQSKNLLGKLVLEKYGDCNDLSPMTQTEALLAVEIKPEFSLKLLNIEKFQLPDIYAAAAECVKDKNRQQAVEFFKKAGKDDSAASLHENFTTDCKILLNKETAYDANKVLAMLKNEDAPMLKARAYWILKDKQQAISELVKAENLDSYDANFCKFVINDIIKDADRMAETCGKSFIENCAIASEKIGDEISAIEFRTMGYDGNDLEKIAGRAEKINSQDYASLRALARFNAKTGNFGRAYELWSKMLTISDENLIPTKYYQLLCLSKMSAADRQTAIHAAEVLLHSRDVPEFWQKKLQNLIYNKP